MPSFTVFKGAEDGVLRQATTVKSDQLVGDQVLIKVTASGICGTDMVLGHEGVGVVQEVGPDVTYVKKGDRVGWGYNMDSCGHCLHCLRGEEIFCHERALYGDANLDQGSFASHAIWRAAFLHKIPDELDDIIAAPLQCAGATVFTALHDVKPNETVGIMGVGGLGHLAIQFAAKMGCRVVVLSNSQSKRDEAISLGAHRFISVESANPKDTNWWPLDRLLVTTSAQPQWDLLLPLMAPLSRIYPLSVSSGDLQIPYMPLILQGITIHGSLVATRAVHREMLEFAAVHKVKPITETFPMTLEGIKAAMDRLESGKIHFRAVLLAE
ncbi:chaperonin 10-like protein [Xylariales sp. PMI_506]|nr:chaperonin 10-like protein [Xylariales sp. PMI_506]